MKVMCIVNETWHCGIGPSYGSVDEVINVHILWGDDYYELERFKGYAFEAAKFIPIDPDLDETTLVNEEWEQKVCVPVNRKL